MGFQRLIPGVGYVNETGSAQRLIPGGGYVSESVSGAPATWSPKIWDGAAWTAKPAKRWDGAAWQPIASAKRWDGAAWQEMAV